MEIAFKLGNIILLSCISAILYNLGGTTGFNTKYRDFGVPTIALSILLILNPTYNLPTMAGELLTWGVCFASLTTYYKKKNTPAKWYHWALVGLGFGLSAFPYCITTKKWGGFFIRTLILIIGVTLWSELISDVKWEERGRGFLFTVTLPLLLL
jgi:hypothetical protein